MLHQSIAIEAILMLVPPYLMLIGGPFLIVFNWKFNQKGTIVRNVVLVSLGILLSIMFELYMYFLIVATY